MDVVAAVAVVAVVVDVVDVVEDGPEVVEGGGHFFLVVGEEMGPNAGGHFGVGELLLDAIG